MAKKGANKGEWSEVYVLLKLLGEGKLYAGDENHRKISRLYYPIESVIRKDKITDNSKAFLDRTYNVNNNRRIVILHENGEEIANFSCDEFVSKARDLLKIIKKNKGAFQLDDENIVAFLTKIHCVSKKAKSVDKADIHIVIHDLRTGLQPKLGFSIKSQVGSPSTLINPGVTTTIAYKLNGRTLSEQELHGVNSIFQLKKDGAVIKQNGKPKMDLIKRVEALNSYGELTYDHYLNSCFENNLKMVDTLLPTIIQKMLLLFYISGKTTCSDLIDEIEKLNSQIENIDLDKYPMFYKRKFSQLLVDAALGMTPAKPWNGEYKATGGYLVVTKQEGNVLCYHFYERNLFEKYLLSTTDLCTPGKHEKYQFGTAYNKNGNTYINLCLQVRFLH